MTRTAKGRRRCLPVVLIVLSAAVLPAGANITDVSVPLDENALFGGDGELVRVIDPAAAAAGTITLVETPPFRTTLQFSGTATASIAGSWNIVSVPGQVRSPDSLLPGLKSVFSLDALMTPAVKLHLDNTTVAGPAGIHSTIFGYWADIRPSELTRFYMSGRTVYDSAAEGTAWSFPLLEAFADAAVERSVFFRFGKQYVSWGVGYWYSPADVLSLAQIDPEDPGAKREGPVAFKADFPYRQNLSTVYLIGAPDLDPAGTALAAKSDFVLGGFELGIGGYFRPDMAVRPRVIAMLTGAVGSVDVFGEGVVAWGSDRTYIRESGPGPGYETYRILDRPVLQATAGFRWSVDGPDRLYSLDMRAQAYYDGSGYEDPSILRRPGIAPWFGTGAGQIPLRDRSNAGMWKAAASLGISGLFDDLLSASVVAIAGISDSSVRVTPKLTVKPDVFSSVSVSLPTTFTARAEPAIVDLKIDISYRAFTF